MSSVIYLPEPIIDSTQVSNPLDATDNVQVGEPMPVELNQRFDTIKNSGFSCEATLEQALEKVRRDGLVRSRNWFMLLALFLAVVSIICGLRGAPYEPFVAAFIANIGIVVVLAMKAAGK